MYFGAVLQNPGTVEVLRHEYRNYLLGLDLSGADPFSDSSDSEERRRQLAAFVEATARAGGMGSLLVHGTAVSDLSAEQRREAMANLVAGPIGFAVGAAAGSTGPAAPAVEKALDSLATGPLRESVMNELDKNDPEASDQAGSLIDAQVAEVSRQLAQQGIALTLTEQDWVRNYVQGLYFEVVEMALRERGG